MIQLSDQGRAAVDAIGYAALPLAYEHERYDALIELVGDAQFVLLGEATHGSHEFYQARAAVTRRLFEEKGFSAVAVEADWPDAYRVNRFVRGQSDDPNPKTALADFQRFPSWMWRNLDVVEFVTWLRDHNAQRAPEERVGFYGLDLYSLRSSIAAVIAYLDGVDPAAAQRARERYGCFSLFGDDPQRYGHLTALGISDACEREVIEQLTELRSRTWEYLKRDGWLAADERFCAEQNARVAQNAERYYREMYKGSVRSWNLRDQHMFATLEALTAHLSRQRPQPKIVVWEHNSHIGDARATSMAERGELNLGQLARQRFADKALLVGFTTYDGTVSAADEWDGPVRLKSVVPARAGSVEKLFHEVALPRFQYHVGDSGRRTVLDLPLLHRAIGVVYRPRTELFSHYLTTRLARQFDVVLHFDRTSAVQPLERTVHWNRGRPEPAEIPETYPTGV